MSTNAESFAAPIPQSPSAGSRRTPTRIVADVDRPESNRNSADLHWSEIDFKNGIIALPGSRTKNHRAHIIAMAPMARTILEARPQNGRDLVFGIGQGGFSGWSQAKTRLDDTVRARTVAGS